MTIEQARILPVGYRLYNDASFYCMPVTMTVVAITGDLIAYVEGCFNPPKGNRCYSPTAGDYYDHEDDYPKWVTLRAFASKCSEWKPLAALSPAAESGKEG